MSTTAVNSATRSRLTFGGILTSEVIKLRTLRSTIWCYAILIVVNVGLGVGLSGIIASQSNNVGSEGAVTIATLAIGFSQLVIVVLGALVITGEYGTGMIRTTFTIAPRRVSALIGKALVFGVVTAIVGGISVLLTALLSAPILSVNGSPVDFGDGKYWVALLGAAGYLALVGLFAFTLGAIIRNSAGGIAAALGAILVLPTIVNIIGGLTQSQVIENIGAFLPSNAGSRMYAYATDTTTTISDTITFQPWQGGLILLAWVVVLFIVASVIVKRRDV